MTPVESPEERVRRLGLGDCPCGAPIESVSVGWTAGDHEMVGVCMRGHRWEDYVLPVTIDRQAFPGGRIEAIMAVLRGRWAISAQSRVHAEADADPEWLRGTAEAILKAMG